MNTAVTLNDMNEALNYIGKPIHVPGNSTRQAFAISNTTYVDLFEIHPLNRNVNITWVKEMKTEMMKAAFDKICPTITVAIDLKLIESIKIDRSDDIDYKVTIMDGQHRIAAMKELIEETPNFNMEFMLDVRIVNGDREMEILLKSLNKRLNFSKDDSDKTQTINAFLQAFNYVVTDKNITRRCVMKVKRSKYLQSKSFVEKHKTTSVDGFVQKLMKVADDYKIRWDNSVSSDPKIVKTAVGEVILTTKLYQIIDDSLEWLKDL